MAKKETRRNESLRLAILLLLLAISQAYAPPFLLAGAFGNSSSGGEHGSRVVLEAAKHGWPGLRHGQSGAKVHDKIGRRDCLRWRLDLSAHCLAAIGFSDGSSNGAGDADDGDTAGGVLASGGGGFGDSGLGGWFILASSGAGSHGGGNPGGGSEGGGSHSGGNSGGGSGGGGDGSHGGGNSGGGSGGGGNSDGGSNGGNGSHGGGNAGDGSHDGGNSGGGREDGGPDSGCSLSNPGACTANGGGDPGNTDCPEQTYCGPPAGGPAATTALPEPSTLWLMAAGIAAMFAGRSRRKLASARNAIA